MPCVLGWEGGVKPPPSPAECGLPPWPFWLALTCGFLVPTMMATGNPRFQQPWAFSRCSEMAQPPQCDSSALGGSLGLLFAHLLFYISSADGVTYSSIGMQATTHEPMQPEIWREALIEPFSILPEARDFLSTWRLTKQKAAQFFFCQHPFIKG